jgi:hypothetical protein
MRSHAGDCILLPTENRFVSVQFPVAHALKAKCESDDKANELRGVLSGGLREPGQRRSYQIRD